MIDYQNLPDNSKIDWFMQPTSGSEVHTWTKPAGCNFVYMIAVGGGGGGGYGGVAASGASRTAGNGGSSGCLTTLLVPAFLIPDTLFLRVGKGGTGGTNVSSTGGGGGATIISAYRVSSATEYLLYADGGTGSGLGTNGLGAATTPLITNNTLGTIGKWQGVASIRGSLGGAGGVAGSDNAMNYFLVGGAGGAGSISTDLPGGGITSAYKQVAAQKVIQGGAAIANATAGQNNGGDGYFIPKRFCSYGGGGGGASTNGVAGGGGNGGPGSGGGGQGAGAIYVDGVSGGGDGGDGFAVIISY